MKKFICIILSMSIVLGTAFTSYAQTNDNNEIKVTKYAENLINGNIKPINEDPNSGLMVKVVDSMEVNNFKTTNYGNNSSKLNSDTILDVRLIDTYKNSDGMDVKNYQAMSIASLSMSNEDELGDVYMYLSINYDKILIDSSNSIYAHRINSVNGQYIKSLDPQMRCKEFELWHKYNGYAYNDNGKFVGNKSNTVSRTVKSPEKGGMYSLITRAPYFSEDIPASSNQARMTFTIKRTVSSYEDTGYFMLGWGRDL